MKTVWNYETADKFLGKKNDRPFAHNTRIVRDADGSILATYHGHPVVNFYPDRTTYSSCGWKTPTTKERLNWFLPEGFSIYQEHSVWFLVKRPWEDNNKWVFADLLTIDNYNRVFNADTLESVVETQKLIKRIKKYVTGYIKAFLNDEVPAPGMGDCWGCLFKNDEGETVMGTGHLVSHMDEKYYVPSLLVNAYTKYPMCQMAMWKFGVVWGGQEDGGGSEWLNDIFTRDATRSLTRYLKFQFGIAE